MKIKIKKISLALVTVFLLISGYSSLNAQQNDESNQKEYTVVESGIHPSLFFSEQEIEELQQKAQGNGFAGDMWDKIKRQANDWPIKGDTAHGDPYAFSNKRGMEMDAKALIYQVEGNKKAGRAALNMMKEVLDEIDPHKYYTEEKYGLLFGDDDWPKEFALAYDWLYPLMTKKEREKISGQLEKWCKALYQHTQDTWWSGAHYNIGAIPVGALGLLCVAIQDEAENPQFDKWLNSALERVSDNYYPTSWRQNGICYEGPDYAQYHKNPTMFGEALRRNGGQDILTNSGAINAMQYLRFQWKPSGQEAPIGDNTNYGRRVFQAIYLLGIGEMNDQAGLHTFLKWSDPSKVNPILAFIFYPADLKPKSAAQLDLKTSKYFEITPNRAGYLFSRSEWNNEDAAFFSFVTRDKGANHQHYDMNSFLFSAFGEDFATHANLWVYQDSLHGVDKEHNMVVVDGGGMPSHDAINGAGDDASLNGYLTGLGTGHFADYVRGDAARSYKDISVENSEPAVRADRYGAFVKQGPNPYVIMVDDIQKSNKATHDYDWLWYSKALELNGGQGTLDNPFIIPGDKANAAVGFVTPDKVKSQFEVIKGESNYGKRELGRINVSQRGKRVKYFAVAAAWDKEKPKPEFESGPKVKGSKAAKNLVVKGDGFTDHILWQPEETHGKPGQELTGGKMSSDAFLSIVRTNEAGKVIDYLIGDGTELTFGDKTLVQSDRPWSVSADTHRVIATGKRRARANRPPLPANGSAWLPSKQAEVRADGKKINPKIENNMAVIGKDL